MVSSAHIVNISESPLNRISSGTVRGQKQEFKTRMLGQPFLNCFRSVRLIIVYDNIDATIKRALTIDGSEQVQKQVGVLTRRDAMVNRSGKNIKRAGQIVPFISSAGRHFQLRAFLHPLITNLRKQVDIEF